MSVKIPQRQQTANENWWEDKNKISASREDAHKQTD